MVDPDEARDALLTRDTVANPNPQGGYSLPVSATWMLRPLEATMYEVLIPFPLIRCLNIVAGIGGLRCSLQIGLVVLGSARW